MKSVGPHEGSNGKKPALTFNLSLDRQTGRQWQWYRYENGGGSNAVAQGEGQRARRGGVAAACGQQPVDVYLGRCTPAIGPAAKRLPRAFFLYSTVQYWS